MLLTDGAVTQRYAAAGEAFTAAQTEEHQDCTLRLLTDLIDDGKPLVHDPVVTITGGRFTLDLHNHTIAGKTSDYKEGVVTVTGGQLRIENGTLENLPTPATTARPRPWTLLGTDTHVTLANVTAIGATPPNGDTSASVYAPDGARLTIESGEFTGRVAGTYASAPTETPHVSIAGGTFHNGLSYSIHETEANAATLLAILKEGYALAHADGTPVDLGTEPSFSPFSGTYTLSGEVQVVAPPTTSAADGRATVAAAMPAPRRPDAGQLLYAAGLLPVRRLLRHSPQDLRTPTGKIIIDENNWWQDFLNTVTFGLFFPTGARFTIEAADDSVDHAGYDPELYPVTVEYLVTDQRYTSDKMGDLADQFRPYPGKAVALPDDQTSIVYAKITDWAGNVTYLSTANLTVDATAPEISSDVAENQIYCQDDLRIAFRDDHLKSVTLNGTEMTYAAEDGARFTAVVMLTNVSLPADAFSLDGIRAVLALEGHTLTLSAPMTLSRAPATSPSVTAPAPARSPVRH